MNGVRGAWRLRSAALTCALALALCAPVRAQVVSPLDYGPASLGDVRLGVALAAAAELIDTPSLLARASSQRFVDDAFARIAATTTDPNVRVRAAGAREALRAQDGVAFDRGRAEGALAELTRDVLRALPSPRDRLCVVGILAESIAYDARVLRAPAVDAQLRKAIGNAAVADTIVPGLAAMRADLAAQRRGRWREIGAMSERIVAAIVGSSFGAPFPPSDGVWVVLLRSAPVDGMRARRFVPHLWLDIVRFDGTHRTLGAYPDDGDFEHDGARMTCGFDREALNESERAVPVVPPPGTTRAQLADALVARCDAALHGAGSYRTRDASDARFVVDALVAAGVDAAAVMREATTGRSDVR